MSRLDQLMENLKWHFLKSRVFYGYRITFKLGLTVKTSNVHKTTEMYLSSIENHLKNIKLHKNDSSLNLSHLLGHFVKRYSVKLTKLNYWFCVEHQRSPVLSYTISLREDSDCMYKNSQLQRMQKSEKDIAVSVSGSSHPFEPRKHQ